MNKFYTLVLMVLCLGVYQVSTAQVGPNLLGAKGTFSAPFITVNTKADACIISGANSYSPTDNIGNKLSGCAANQFFLPCSDYNYTSKKNGLGPEFTYTIIKNIGNASGYNCIKGDWRGQDHTGDGGYFLAVNGAPDKNYSNIFYKIKSIPVCVGTKYEFSAWVLNILPSSSTAAKPGSEPNISFKVNGKIIGNSGAIAYTVNATWVKVGGTFVATTNTVDLEVVNATQVASGNDLGLDDISFNVVESNIAISGAPTSICEGTSFTINYVVTDTTRTNIWYKWLKSIDGGQKFDTISISKTASFSGNSYTVPLVLSNVTSEMNGYKYRLLISTSEAGLANPGCSNVNEYTISHIASCGPMPVTLTSFNGKYSNGAAYLDWQTSQELNSDRFEIYRSFDGEDFSLIASVKSAGNSNTIKNYNYQDNDVNGAQYVYYRLKQIDNNGKNFVFSSVIKVVVAAKTTGIQVFPNPFDNNFTASFSASKTTDATLTLRNTMGQPVFQKNIQVTKGINSIPINNLPSLKTGIYYLTIVNDDINYNSKLQKR